MEKEELIFVVGTLATLAFMIGYIAALKGCV